MCECKEKVVLARGDGLNIATEVWCPKHGYQNSCWFCNRMNKYDEKNKTTELCIKCTILLIHSAEAELLPGSIA